MDERSRLRERQARAGGGPEAEAAVLRDRIRRGALEQRRLEFAAALGHLPSRIVLGGTGAWCVHDKHWGTCLGKDTVPTHEDQVARAQHLRGGALHHHHDHKCLTVAMPPREWRETIRAYGRLAAVLAWIAVARECLKVVYSRGPAHPAAGHHWQEELVRAEQVIDLAVRWTETPNTDYRNSWADLVYGTYRLPNWVISRDRPFYLAMTSAEVVLKERTQPIVLDALLPWLLR